MTLHDYLSKDDEIKELKNIVKTLNSKIDCANKLMIIEASKFTDTLAVIDTELTQAKARKETINALNEKVDDINILRAVEKELCNKRIASLNASKRVMEIKMTLAVKSKLTNERKVFNVLRAVIGLRDDGFIELTNDQIADRYFTTVGNIRSIITRMKKDK